MFVPFQVPEVTVPKVVIEDDPAAGAYAVEAVNAAEPSVPPAPILSVEESVPASVSVFETVNVFDVVEPPASVNPVVNGVSVIPLIAVDVEVNSVAEDGIVVPFTDVTPANAVIVPVPCATVIAVVPI